MRKRIESIDLVRGLVMVLMALDHTRDYFSNSPLNISIANPPLFLTRWVTHFCAPTFVFLAGTSAFFLLQKMKSRARLAKFLVTRGTWLIFLELTLVHCFWDFTLQFNQLFLSILWALGWCMIFLAGFIFLPQALLLAISLLLVIGHNLLDGIPSESFGGLAPIWKVLHVYLSEVGVGPKFLIVYPLIPWIGVMALGFSFGNLWNLKAAVRRKILLTLGLGLIIGFVFLRFFNLYGDPNLWKETDPHFLLSFLDCTKYPASLQFLLMTLGPVIFFLGILERGSPSFLKPLGTFGRVPMFFYLIHIPVIHALALLAALLQTGEWKWMLDGFTENTASAGYGFSVFELYWIWISIVMFLYPVCRWYAKRKSNGKSVWYSYF